MKFATEDVFGYKFICFIQLTSFIQLFRLLLQYSKIIF